LLLQETPASSRIVVGPPRFDNGRAFWGDVFDPNAKSRVQSVSYLANAESALARNFGPGAECTPPPAGMVSWWAADNHALDIRGGSNGSLQNGATFAPGKVAQAFSFDGVDDYVDVQGSPAIGAINSITVEAWINPQVSIGVAGHIFATRTPQISE